MIKAFFASRKWALWAYGGAALLLFSLYWQVQFTVYINDWYGSFYNILQKPQEHDISEFWASIRYFFVLAIPYVFIATVTGYFTRLYAFRWRKAITFDYIPRWRNVSRDVEGASQRLQEDAARFAKILESLGLQIARAVMTLIAFLPVLWKLSEHIQIKELETLLRAGHIEGSLVWVVLVASLGSMVISWVVGGKLPGLEFNNQVVEAAFRKELVYGEDDKINYASIPELTKLFTGIEFNYHRLFLHYGYFDVWVNLYDQCLLVVPYIIAAPSLFSDAISLGILVQISNAFGKVHNSFALFTHNWTTITELRSIHKRLKQFEKNIGPIGQAT